MAYTEIMIQRIYEPPGAYPEAEFALITPDNYLDCVL